MKRSTVRDKGNTSHRRGSVDFKSACQHADGIPAHRHGRTCKAGIGVTVFVGDPAIADHGLGLEVHRWHREAVPTFHRIFTTLDPKGFAECFIAIDGKTVRHSFDHGDPDNSIHLVSAWADGCGLSLGQLLVDGKSNEITAVPKLLRQLDVKGATVSLDAMAGSSRRGIFPPSDIDLPMVGGRRQPNPSTHDRSIDQPASSQRELLANRKRRFFNRLLRA